MIKLNLDEIPVEAGRRLGEAIMKDFREFMKQPGANEQLEFYHAARLARMAAKKHNDTDLS